MRILELAHEAELLLKDPDVRGISYVGSTSVGRHIYQTAAAHGKRVQALRPGDTSQAPRRRRCSLVWVSPETGPEAALKLD